MLDFNKPLITLEIANNHNGYLEHGKKILDTYQKITSKYESVFKFAVKFQYRNLDTFIHDSFKGSQLKYVKRFEETRLNISQQIELKEYAQKLNFTTMCTPFDEDSVKRVIDEKYDILKIASCSIDDWPLLSSLKGCNLPIIASLGGGNLNDISKLNSFFRHCGFKYALQYCVGLYPTNENQTNLSFLKFLIKRYPKLDFGYSTHEDPSNCLSAPMALAMGAKLFEKHICVVDESKGIFANKYSSTPTQLDDWLKAMQLAINLMGSVGAREEVLKVERSSLSKLKRGVYVDKKVSAKSRLELNDVQLSIPVQENQADASIFSSYSLIQTSKEIKRHEPLLNQDFFVEETRSKLTEIKNRCESILIAAGIDIPYGERLEVSHHYGINKFYEFGTSMITVLNREYCKKYIFLFAGQKHPEQYHKQKDETFILLYGDCKLILDNEEYFLEKNQPISVKPKVIHSFSSNQGALIEEISTTHEKADSFYVDDKISNNLSRKSFIDF